MNCENIIENQKCAYLFIFKRIYDIIILIFHYIAN